MSEDIYETSSGVIRDRTEVVPFVGLSGKFTTKAPFTLAIQPNVEYTVVTVSNLSGLIASGIDPWTDIYEPQGGTRLIYEEDLAHNRCVISLQAGVGNVLVVPNSALAIKPIDDGVRYLSMLMTASLSALPEDTDLTELKNDVADLIFQRLGVRSTIYPQVVGNAVLVSHENHAAIEAARQANITYFGSNMTRIIELEAKVQAQLDTINQLNEFIANNFVP